MNIREQLRDERGIALLVVLLIAIALAALSLGAGMLSSSTSAIDLYSDRLSVLEAAAEGGLEEGRSTINGNKTLYPDSGYATLESGAEVDDVDGTAIPHVRRSLYVGPTGVTSGQYGVFGSIVVVVEDDFGNTIVRRNEVFQESFAKYAYFTDSEGGNIYFGGGDQIFGPLHTNDQMKIHSTGATFHSSVETAQDVYQPGNGDFKQGYTEWGRYIPMPQTAELVKLQVQGQAGSTAFVGNSNGGHGQATTRLEFVAVDLNADGDVSDETEGFVRVYQHLTNPDWVMGDVPADYGANGLENSVSCGAIDDDDGQFVVAAAMGDPEWEDELADATRRCYPGGAELLHNPDGFIAVDPQGGR